jgi:MSHA biogenesis protein MshL
VAKVGRDLSSTISQTTIETKDVKTGLDLNIFGEEHDKTIYTRINLSITELLRLTRYQALGIDLNLPELADREMKTQVRSRPGDTILLGGIVINKAENERNIGSSINQSINDVSQSEWSS